MTDQSLINPFSLKGVQNPWLKKLIQVISKLDVLERMYDQWLIHNGGKHGSSGTFLDYSIDVLGLRPELVHAAKLEAIPESGPFVFVANHPLGGLEGLVLTQALRARRPDLKVLTNQLLSTIPEFEDIFIGVDVLNPNMAAYNAKGMREVSRHLSEGGALLVFPAGTVSRISVPSFEITDAPWNSMIVRLSRKYQAPIMPFFIEGRNSYLFYLSGLIHKRLRTALLPRAMLSKMGQALRVQVGDIISAGDLVRLDDIIGMHYIRMCCEVLGLKKDTKVMRSSGPMLALRDDVAPDVVTAQIAALSEYEVLRQNNFSVFITPYEQMGSVMEQLSIVRERTFRAVDEGTGKEIDSDRFDPHYEHLFIWDHDTAQIAGGYRICKADQVLKAQSLEGLYSHSLFEYGESFLNKLGKAIEVGRSFIADDYQRNPAALDLLWKGIGQYVAKYPEYHTLFGCVSISNQYSNLTTKLLTEAFLYRYKADDALTIDVKARSPLTEEVSPWTAEQLSHLSDIPIINKLVGRIETGQSIPVLIRHYIALNGRFISFTVNKGFNDSLDGLILVDLRKSPERYLKRYMGADLAKDFQIRHNIV